MNAPWDIGHHILPTLPFIFHNLITFAILLVCCWQLYNSKVTNDVTPSTNMYIFKDILLRVGIFCVLRTIMISSTRFPTNIRCGHTLNPSGHSGVTFIFLMSLWKENILGTIPFALLTMLQFITPIVTRAHHTIDPIVSFFISWVLVQNVTIRS